MISASGRRKAHIPGNLARYLFNKRYQQFHLDRTAHFYELAGGLYDPTAPVMNDQEVEVLPHNEVDHEDVEAEMFDWFLISLLFRALIFIPLYT